MKRIFGVFAVLLVCVSLCLNVAFASDVIQSSVSQNIFVYFPWFGGVGTAGSRVTNYGTVIQSDVTSVSTSFNQKFNFNFDYSGNVSLSGHGQTITVTGSRSTTSTNFLLTEFATVSDHKYYIQTIGNDILIRIRDQDSGSYTNLSSDGTFFTANSASYTLRCRIEANVQINESFICQLYDLTEIFGAGSEVSSRDDLLDFFGAISYSYPHDSSIFSINQSTFSLVPMPALQGGGSQHQIIDYTWYQYEADISLSGSNNQLQTIANYMYSDPNDPYVLWGVLSGNNSNVLSRIYYTRQSFYTNYTPQYYPKVLLGFGTWSNYSLSNSPGCYLDVDPSLIPLTGDFFSNEVYLSNSSVYTLTFINLGNSAVIQSQNTIIGVNEDEFIDNLNTHRLLSVTDSSLDGTFTIDRIFQTADNSYFLMNNQVQLGTYDFNINVKFPSLDKFNSFSGYWMGSFNTSWGEIPVRTQVQEVSANSDTLIKIYKVTFDVPFSGQYTKFNIKYVGDSSAFTTIRLDASVLDSNAYLNGAGPTTINGFSFFLSSKLDQLWAKIRSLFFDQDQTYEQVAQSSASTELAQDSAEVSEGASTIHEYETENFDSIEQQMDNLDWEIPNDFGSASDPNSAIGFISTFFGGIFLSLGSKVQVLIVIPLMLGLCLLILGRGSQALGAINKLFR